MSGENQRVKERIATLRANEVAQKAVETKKAEEEQVRAVRRAVQATAKNAPSSVSPATASAPTAPSVLSTPSSVRSRVNSSSTSPASSRRTNLAANLLNQQLAAGRSQAPKTTQFTQPTARIAGSSVSMPTPPVKFHVAPSDLNVLKNPKAVSVATPEPKTDSENLLNKPTPLFPVMSNPTLADSTREEGEDLEALKTEFKILKRQLKVPTKNTAISFGDFAAQFNNLSLKIDIIKAKINCHEKITPGVSTKATTQIDSDSDSDTDLYTDFDHKPAPTLDIHAEQIEFAEQIKLLEEILACRSSPTYSTKLSTIAEEPEEKASFSSFAEMLSSFVESINFPASRLGEEKTAVESTLPLPPNVVVTFTEIQLNALFKYLENDNKSHKASLTTITSGDKECVKGLKAKLGELNQQREALIGSMASGRLSRSVDQQIAKIKTEIVLNEWVSNILGDDSALQSKAEGEKLEKAGDYCLNNSSFQLVCSCPQADVMNWWFSTQIFGKKEDTKPLLTKQVPFSLSTAASMSRFLAPPVSLSSATASSSSSLKSSAQNQK